MTLEEYIQHFRLDPDSELFHELCEDADIEIIRPLLEQTTEDNRPLLSRNNLSDALIKTVIVNELEIVKLLIAHGADVNANQQMALHQARYFNYPAIIDCLTKAASSSSSSQDYSPSFFKVGNEEPLSSESSIFEDFCKAGNINLVSELLESNQVSSENIFKGLIHAIAMHNLNVVQEITLKGPRLDFDFQYQGATIVGHAINFGHDTILNHLLQIQALQTGSLNEDEQMALFTQTHGLVEAEIGEQVDMSELNEDDYAYFGF